MDMVITSFASQEAQRRILRLLESGGFSPIACGPSGAEVIRTVHQLGTAAVVCGFKLRDMTAGQLAYALEGRAGLLVVSSAANLDLCQGENLFKLPTPITRADFFASLDLTLHLVSSAGKRAPAPPEEEGDAAVIRRAKALLMDVNRMTEAEAHRCLQKRSMDAGMHLAETARLIIESHS